MCIMAPGSANMDALHGSPPTWFFTPEALLKTPTIKDYMRESAKSDKRPEDERQRDAQHRELQHRQQAANFAQDLGQKLQLPQLCLNTAIVYCHRFYVYHSFVRFPGTDVAAACVFLAGKAEETPRKLEHVVKISYSLQHREEEPLDVKSNKYLDEAQKIVMYENILLQTLGFDLQVDHPHAFVVKCCQLVKAPRDLAQASYILATDSLRLTTFSLRYRPAVVACVCIYLACKWASWEVE